MSFNNSSPNPQPEKVVVEVRSHPIQPPRSPSPPIQEQGPPSAPLSGQTTPSQTPRRGSKRNPQVETGLRKSLEEIRSRYNGGAGAWPGGSGTNELAHPGTPSAAEGSALYGEMVTASGSQSFAYKETPKGDEATALQRSPDKIVADNPKIIEQFDSRAETEREKEHMSLEELERINAEIYGEEEPLGGKNIVCCGGRIVMGPHIRQLLISLTSITVPFVMSEAVLRSHIPLWLEICDMIVYAASIITLMLTATRNPGIVTKRKEHVSVDMKVNVITETGRNVDVRYCYTCHIYKGPRTVHCRECNNCVDQFDHHCPWTGTCIGVNNYHLFLYFLHSLAIAIPFMFLTLAWAPVQISAEKEVSMIDAMGEVFYFPMVLLPFVFFAGNGVQGLLFYHYFLGCIGQTTAEHLRSTYDSEDGNPFHFGPAANCFRRCAGWVDGEVLSSMYKRKMVEQLQKKIDRAADKQR